MGNETNLNENSSIRYKTHRGIDKVMDKAESMNESRKEAVARLKEGSLHVKENVDGYIRRNPEKSVMIAAGVGAVAGAVITAAMMRKKQKI